MLAIACSGPSVDSPEESATTDSGDPGVAPTPPLTRVAVAGSYCRAVAW